MRILSKQTKQETIIYTAVWIILFLAPIVDLLFYYDDHNTIWVKNSLIDTWTTLLSFLVVFLIHNHILAPMLVQHKREKVYIAGCLVVIVLAMFSLYLNRPLGPMGDPQGPPQSENVGILAPPPPLDMGGKRPPISMHDVSMFTILILMMGANLGCKIFFRAEEEKHHLVVLKEQSLKQELAYLRYQISPHFFMNTLNNIHALVDIDPEQAKDSIVDMSRMMRYLLYETDKHYVTLDNAVVFLKKHLNLMKLRYTDQVTINLDVPEPTPDNVVIAPLVFIPFVENAFKHGVVYNKPSVIDIGIRCEGNRLIFHTRNCKSNAKHEFGGVGLSNVTKRLELIYGNDYSLDIKDEERTYDVRLDLPVRSASDFTETTNH